MLSQCLVSAFSSSVRFGESIRFQFFCFLRGREDIHPHIHTHTRAPCRRTPPPQRSAVTAARFIRTASNICPQLFRDENRTINSSQSIGFVSFFPLLLLVFEGTCLFLLLLLRFLASEILVLWLFHSSFFSSCTLIWGGEAKKKKRGKKKSKANSILLSLLLLLLLRGLFVFSPRAHLKITVSHSGVATPFRHRDFFPSVQQRRKRKKIEKKHSRSKPWSSCLFWSCGCVLVFPIIQLSSDHCKAVKLKIF